MKPTKNPPTPPPAPRPQLPPLTRPAPLEALHPLGIKNSPPSRGWADTQPAPVRHELELFDVERGTAFEESLNGLQVRELIGSKLFERLFGPRDPDET